MICAQRNLLTVAHSRCISHNTDALCARLRHQIPRPFLGSCLLLLLELQPKDILHPVITLHNHTYDAGLCKNPRAGEILETWSDMSRWISSLRPFNLLNL